MKASFKFREEKRPLVRAKLPFKACGIPLSSGVVVGHSQELALSLGTFLPAGPSIKLEFKPNDSSPLSVVLKAGLGLWGSPNGAPLTIKAEFAAYRKGGDPLFTLQLKPRCGDFSIRKEMNVAMFFPFQQKATETALAPLADSLALTLPNDKIAISAPSPLTDGDTKTTPKRNSANFAEKDRARSPTVDSNGVIVGSNLSLKIEEFEKDWKGRHDKKLKGEGVKELDTDADAMATGTGTIAGSPYEESNEQGKLEGRGCTPFSFARAQNCLESCRIVAHSILPIYPQVRLNIRWGVKPPLELFQGWDGSLPSLSISKLPSLLFDKISIEQVSIPAKKPKALSDGYLEGGLIPVSFLEENRELAQVATLCYTMKRQLHLLYAENQVLRRSMEDMRSQVELRGFRAMNGTDEIPASREQAFSRPSSKSPLLDVSRPSHTPREDAHREVNTRKGQREAQRKDTDPSRIDIEALPVLDGTGSDVSKELEKAIKGAKNGLGGGKKD